MEITIKCEVDELAALARRAAGKRVSEGDLMRQLVETFFSAWPTTRGTGVAAQG
jgi:hypothetical protein